MAHAQEKEYEREEVRMGSILTTQQIPAIVWLWLHVTDTVTFAIANEP